MPPDLFAGGFPPAFLLSGSPPTFIALQQHTVNFKKILPDSVTEPRQPGFPEMLQNYALRKTLCH
jgi:hypothetical protein